MAHKAKIFTISLQKTFVGLCHRVLKSEQSTSILISSPLFSVPSFYCYSSITMYPRLSFNLRGKLGFNPKIQKKWLDVHHSYFNRCSYLNGGRREEARLEQRIQKVKYGCY